MKHTVYRFRHMQVMDTQDYMAGTPSPRSSPMRIQHDIDISIGYMHSGYPIMTFMDVVEGTLQTTGGKWQVHCRSVALVVRCALLLADLSVY